MMVTKDTMDKKRAVSTKLNSMPELSINSNRSENGEDEMIIERNTNYDPYDRDMHTIPRQLTIGSIFSKSRSISEASDKNKMSRFK